MMPALAYLLTIPGAAAVAAIAWLEARRYWRSVRDRRERERLEELARQEEELELEWPWPRWSA